MGVPTPSAYVAASLAYTFEGGIAEKISCPTLVCEAEDDLFFKGQPQQLLDHLTCPKTLIRFSLAEGLGDHCQVAGHRMALGRTYDWLDETLAGLPVTAP